MFPKGLRYRLQQYLLTGIFVCACFLFRAVCCQDLSVCRQDLSVCFLDLSVCLSCCPACFAALLVYCFAACFLCSERSIAYHTYLQACVCFAAVPRFDAPSFRFVFRFPSFEDEKNPVCVMWPSSCLPSADLMRPHASIVSERRRV